MEIKTNLLPHQIAAVEKLQKIKIGALYMEMGTGKTRTALELIKLRLDAKKIEQVLWLCPCSVKANLLADIRKHSDLADGPLTICGIETLSSSVRECSGMLELVTSKPTYLIVDESSLVKNHHALRSIHITQLAENCKYKLILNGTPVSKCEADLFSQWYLLDWRILGYRSYYSFAANHIEYDERHPGKIRRALHVDYLVAKIAPYTYQVKKDECMTLPKKKYRRVGFNMTNDQDANYEYVIENLLSEDDDDSIAVYQLFGALTSVTSGFAVKIHKDGSTERFPMFLDPKDNPRIKELLCQIGNEKTIIFCRYTQEIEDIVAVLNAGEPGCAVPFDGTLPLKKRQASIEKFRESAKYLVANKNCGAFGLNLQFCHKIIYYSNDWDWGTRAQSEDRVHRLGQDSEVEIIDLYACWSIDSKILDCLDRKEGLVDNFKGELGKSKDDIIKFVRGGKTDGKAIYKENRA